MNDEYEITDYNYITSAVGNAYFSGLTFDDLWGCISLSQNREELDEAVSAAIYLNELIEKGNIK